MHLRLQELLGWGGPHFSDCFRLMRRTVNDADAAPELSRFEHPSMTSEMGLAKVLHESYWGESLVLRHFVREGVLAID